MMKTTKRHLIIILVTLFLSLFGVCTVSWGHVYWKPNNGNDDNDGSTAAKAVKTWTRAMALLSGQASGEPIYLTEKLTISSNTTLNGAISGKANARVIRNIADGYLIRVNSGVTLTLKNITISGELSSATPHPNGVKSLIETSGVVVLDNGSVLRDNHAKATDEPWGGAIRLYNGSTLTMKAGSLITGCKAQKSGGTNLSEGGAVMSGGSCTVNINGGTIENCTSGDIGGAFALRGGEYTFNMTGGTITGCTAPKGGAIYIAPIENGATYTNVKATITMSGGTIKNCNNAITSGAAFYVGSSGTNNSITLNLNGGTIDNCDASGTGDNGGGGVFCNQGTLVLNMSGTTIKNCDATRGGGIYVSGAKANITLSGGVIDNCTGSVYGGGAFVNSLAEGSSFKMDNTTAGTTGCEIKNCSSKGYNGGGGLFLQGANMATNLTKGLIHDCRNEDPETPGNGRGGGLLLGNGITAYIDGDNMKIYDNYSANYGGGIQLSNSTLYFSKGEIYGNEAGHGAAGIHVSRSGSNTTTFNMSGGKLYENETPGVGGGIHSSEGCTLSITGGEIYDNIAHTQGGGININTRCNLEIPSNSTLEMYGNSACRGGAIMVDGATLTIHAGSYHDNQALDSYTPSGSNVQVDTYGTGGAFCLVTANNTNTFASEFYLYDGDIYDNIATTQGGGIYMGKTTSTNQSTNVLLDDDPEIHIYGGTISGNQAQNGNGGGVFLESGTFEMTGGSLDGNSTTDKGGGVYFTEVSGRTAKVNITGGEMINNEAVYGGGLAVEGGECNLKDSSKGTGVSIGASGNPNTATYGGGLYANGGTTTITKGNVQYNEATQDGGGIYANGGTVNVQYAATTDGKIHHNYAGQRGGGLFISSSGSLNLEGKTTLEYNRVPKGELGGGVYLEGTVQAGASSTDVIIVKDNYADNTEGATITATNRNNIYLPNPVDTQTSDVITVVNNGLNLSSSKIGFSVPHNFVPVIYCSTASYLSPTIMNSEAIFEDSERYNKYYSTTAPYKANYIYLSADTWFAAVPSQPSGFSYENIDSPEDLAWLISLVNGRTTPSAVTASTLSGITIKLTADIDMKAHTWVPIGFTGKSFNGIFDGNGHTISNVYCSYLGEGEGGTGRGLGLFGTVENATIHDVFVNGVELQVKNQTGSDAYTMGAIANEAKGTTSIYNCTAASNMESTMVNTTMGGLVGKLTSGTIHSSAAMPDMMGYAMGGLAGTNAGTIYNSFANPKFKYSGADNAYFVGGLVADNSGIIQNCYVRFSRPSTFTNAAKFGQLVGKTAASKVTVCYHPTTYASGITSALVNDGSVSSTIYGDVVAPYLYNHSNDNSVGSTNVTLCNQLNAWVSTNNSTPDRPTCAQWKRTTAGGYVTNEGNSIGGNINGDYPIHKYSDYKCVASTDGINLDYAPTLDAMLTRHTSNATINLYAHDRTTASTGNGVVVYIDENVSLLQDVGEETVGSVIEAYTSQTLPGNPRSWHFLSSSLSNSGIGFNYGQSAAFNWEPNPCHVTISGDDDASLFPSDLPMSGGYADVSKIDLYAFYEPEYHWINLKRNSNSHWHMNATTEPIAYTNETTLTPGKGYLVSIDKDQLLQNRGTLNNGEVEIALGYTPAQEWAGLVGYNLIGNPYQSYLDFPAFASQNSGLWYDGSKGKAVEPTYAVYDSEMGGYIQYKEGASRGSKSASGILNMHQGFMVRSSGATRAKFTNAMRTNDGNGVSFRGEQAAYPLINLTVTDDEGVNDFAVLELGRDRDEGAEKLRANDSKGWLYLHHGSENYGILFRSEVDDYQPLWFEADEAGSYTLSWETANAEFEALTLIDNITGVVTDMLAHDRYTFEATPEQYASRFKIVIGDYKDIEENEAPEPFEGPTFAYYANGEIRLVETQNFASLQIIDMTGRVILCRDASHASVISTDGIASGIYVLRLTDGKGTKIQKIVIE